MSNVDSAILAEEKLFDKYADEAQKAIDNLLSAYPSDKDIMASAIVESAINSAAEVVGLEEVAEALRDMLKQIDDEINNNDDDEDDDY